MRFIVIAIIALMGCIVIALLDDILGIINLRKRVKAWFKDFKGVIR